MRLVLIHGRAQQGKNPQAEQDRWEMALYEAWTKAGIKRPASLDVRFPFYGDELDRLLKELKSGRRLTWMGAEDVDSSITPFEEEYLRAMIADAGITEEEVRAEMPTQVIDQGPQNWEWVQAGVRVLSRRVPLVGTIGLGFTADAEAYLTRPHIRTAVNDIVRPHIEDAAEVVVVGHSLGSVVAFDVLRALNGKVPVRQLVTLGSPLGIDVIKRYLRPPPLGIPIKVANWFNATDERDPVALFSMLDATTFAGGIDNAKNVKNSRDDPHSIVDYLHDTAVAKRIADAVA